MTTLRPLYNKTSTELSRGEVDFGLRDKQGRAVGYAWRIFRAVYTPVPEGQLYGCYLPEGAPVAPEGYPVEHLAVGAYPTRNGQHYGPSQYEVPCRTQAEAEAIIDKRVAQARKREGRRFQ